MFHPARSSVGRRCACLGAVLSLLSCATATRAIADHLNLEIDGGVSEVINDGQTHTVDSVQVGILSNGELTILNGSMVESTSSSIIGREAGSSGLIGVNGAGSKFISGSDLVVGQSGIGTLGIANDALVHVGSMLSINASSAVDLHGGTLRFDGYSNSGTFNYTSGTIQLAGDRTIGTDVAITDLFGPTPTIPSGKGLTVEGNATIDSLTVGGTFTAGSVVGASRDAIELQDEASVLGVGLNDLNSTLEVGISGPGVLAKLGSGSVALIGGQKTQERVDLLEGTLILLQPHHLMSTDGTARFAGGGLRTEDSLGFVNELSFTDTQTFQIEAAGGFIDVSDAAFTTTLAASTTLSGTGTLEKRGAGRLVLVDQHNFAGRIHVLDGELVSEQTTSGTFRATVLGDEHWTKRGPGSLTVEKTQPFTGTLSIEEGQLRITFDERLHNDAHVHLDGGELVVDGADETLRELTATPQGRLTLGFGSSLIVDSDTDATFNGTLSSIGTFTKRGSGKYTIDGQLEFESGDFFVDDGVLEVVTGNMQPLRGHFTPNTGGELQIRTPDPADIVTSSFQGAGTLRKRGPGHLKAPFLGNDLAVFVDQGTLEIDRTDLEHTIPIQNSAKVLVTSSALGGFYVASPSITGAGQVELATDLDLSAIPWTGHTIFSGVSHNLFPVDPTDTVTFPRGLTVKEGATLLVSPYAGATLGGTSGISGSTIDGSLVFLGGASGGTPVGVTHPIHVGPTGFLSLGPGSSLHMPFGRPFSRFTLDGVLNLVDARFEGFDVEAAAGSGIRVRGGESLIRAVNLVGSPDLEIDEGAMLQLEVVDFVVGASDATPVNLSFNGLGEVNFDGPLNALYLTLGDPSQGLYDQLHFAGKVTPGGILAINFQPGFDDTPGTLYEFMTAASWGPGQFTFSGGAQSLSLSNGKRLQIVGPGLLEVIGFPGDYNGDGSVDAADYVVWRKTDGTHDGYNTWKQNFGATAGGGGAGTAVAAPEPGALALLLTGLILVSAYGRS